VLACIPLGIVPACRPACSLLHPQANHTVSQHRHAMPTAHWLPASRPRAFPPFFLHNTQAQRQQEKQLKAQRELFVGNLAPGAVNEASLYQVFHSALIAAFPQAAQPGQEPVLKVMGCAGMCWGVHEGAARPGWCMGQSEWC
jgi:hypothetical protein